MGALLLPLTLSACGADLSSLTGGEGASGDPITLADKGPAFCFEQAVEHLGGKTLVMDIHASYSSGQLDPDLINPEDTPTPASWSCAR